jgi:hypothetical protein
MPSAQALAGQVLTGVVLKIDPERTEYQANTGWAGHRPVRIRMIDLFVKPNTVVVLAAPASAELEVGMILKVRLTFAQFESRLVLLASEAEPITPRDVDTSG